MAKLTLSVDDKVITSAERYAKRYGLSVSEIVEAYLAALVKEPSSAPRDAAVLRALRGSLKKADIEEYRRHLATKYR
ncbi:MAG: toxin-antitoxin system protein [Bryobacterales bacterium]|nr:toxin-antitoxin system protein [Bryobacterales bacterium]